jgi:hypothetical protein
LIQIVSVSRIDLRDGLLVSLDCFLDSVQSRLNQALIIPIDAF